MRSFELVRARTFGEARAAREAVDGSALKAGGIDLLDHLKEHLSRPPRLVDLRSIATAREVIRQPDGALRIGPLATLADVAASAVVRASHPALAEACGAAASPQIRNVATLGGNLLQRPRCWYYRLESYPCLKKGGSVCYAVNGENRYHAIFGGGPSYAPHPSNAAVPLVAMDATLVLEGSARTREVPAGEFFTPPSKDATRENALRDDEILTEIRVPSLEGARSVYADVREKESFDWPLVSVAAVIRRRSEMTSHARVVLGAVAPIPWRARAVEKALVGRRLEVDVIAAAARASIVGATPLSDNKYKVALLQTLVRRTLRGLA